jgi:hypothetical protein
MQMHPTHAHTLANERINDISRQIREARLVQSIKALEQEKNGSSPARLSLASLRRLVGFGNGRAAQSPELVKPLKPEEQCC